MYIDAESSGPGPLLRPYLQSRNGLAVMLWLTYLRGTIASLTEAGKSCVVGRRPGMVTRPGAVWFCDDVGG